MTPVMDAKAARPSESARKEPPEGGHAPAGAPTPRAEGVTPAAGTTGLSPITTNFSVAPGPVWGQFTNTTAISVASGTTATVVAEVPLQGALGTFLMQFVSDPSRPDTPTSPMGAIVLALPTPVATPTLPVPQFPNPIAHSTPGLPAQVGINHITVEPNIQPQTATSNGTAGTITIHLASTAAASIPAGRLWLLFAMTGV